MNKLILAAVSVMLTGCASTEPGSVAAVRRIVGTDLIGARGATPEDQRKIDRTVVGICGPRIYTKQECAAHDKAVNQSR